MFGQGQLTSRPRLWALAALVAATAVATLLSTDQGPASAAGGVVQISAGARHTCALMADSTVTCWGENFSGQLGDGTDNDSITPVTVCDSGSGVGCSGGAPLTGVEAISAGRFHTCALMQNSRIRCWGDNERGRLGDGTAGLIRRNAVEVCASGSGSGCAGGSPLTGAVMVAAGVNHTCALMENTTIRCWGDNTSGQLGIGESNDESNPWPETVCEPFVPTLGTRALAPSGLTTVCSHVSGFTSIDAGSLFTCGTVESGGVKCWGSGSSGRLGNNSTESRFSPVDVCFVFVIIVPISAGAECVPISGVVRVAVGDGHACALGEDGRVRCWGNNTGGQIGDGTMGDDRLTPVFVCASGSGAGCSGGQFLEGIQAISAGGPHTCAIAQAGDIRCWGDNAYGSLGDGTMTNRLNPVSVSGFTADAVSITTGLLHSCGATEAGIARCWGLNTFDQLGAPAFDDCAGTNNCSLVPLTVGFDPKPTATPTPPDDTPTPTNTPAGPTATSTPPAPTNTPGGPTPTPGGQAGDVDCSGDVTAIDAALLLQFLAGLLSELPCPENADVNLDGNVNAVDAALILQFGAGLLPSLPP